MRRIRQPIALALALIALMLIAAVALIRPASAQLPSAMAPSGGGVAAPAQAPLIRGRLLNPHSAGQPISSKPSAAAPKVPPVFGTDVRVSFDNPGEPHNEHFGAANPLNPLHFLTGANAYSANSFSGVYRSNDGGPTWAGGSLAGPYPGGAGIVPGGDPAGDFDAAVAPQYTYFADLGYNLSNDCIGGVYVHASTDGGGTFAPPCRSCRTRRRPSTTRSGWPPTSRTAAPSPARST